MFYALLQSERSTEPARSRIRCLRSLFREKIQGMRTELCWIGRLPRKSDPTQNQQVTPGSN